MPLRFWTYNRSMRHCIFILQIVAYASIIPMLAFGHWYHYAASVVVYFLFGCIGMIMTYHRLLTHRSFKCPLWWEYLGVLFATFSLTGSAISWVAIHRKHHRYADTENDPHSPDYLGWWRVQFCTAYASVEGRYATDLMRNKWYLRQHNYYLYMHLSLMVALWFIDPLAVVYAYLFPAFLTLFLGTLILSTAHHDKKPRNLFVLAMLTWGDAFHEIHHDNSQLYRLHKYDITGWLIEKLFVKSYDKTASLG
jgi:sn-2 palmitoyl-lipid 9-desaturase